MRKQRKIGKILTLILLSVIILVYLLANFFTLKSILLSMDLLNLLLSMFLYAAIPCVFAVILRAKFRKSTQWIALAATIISVVCLIILVAADAETLADNEWISNFAQCALTSSVPVLYCVAFFGTKQEVYALVPALLYFLSFFLRNAMIYGFGGVLNIIRHLDLQFVLFEDPDPLILAYMVTIVLMSAIFAVWALLCLFISRMTYIFVRRFLKNNTNTNLLRREYHE